MIAVQIIYFYCSFSSFFKLNVHVTFVFLLISELNYFIHASVYVLFMNIITYHQHIPVAVISRRVHHEHPKQDVVYCYRHQKVFYTCSAGKAYPVWFCREHRSILAYFGTWKNQRICIKQILSIKSIFNYTKQIEKSWTKFIRTNQHRYRKLFLVY